jgi:hypothetical protein
MSDRPEVRMAEINAYSTTPLSEVEGSAIEYLNFARQQGIKLDGIYIAGIYKTKDGDLDCHSSYDGCDMMQLSIVLGMLLRDFTERILNAAEVKTNLTPEAIQIIKDTVRDAIKEEDND